MKCLESGDKLDLINLERKLTIEQCLSMPLLINHKSKEADFIKAIFVIVQRFNDLINVGKKMNENQMIALSADLYDRFRSESLEDILLFFKMARQGDFGDIYRLDSIVILSWIEKYFDLKITAREDEMQNERNIRERQENDAVKNHVPDEKAIEYLDKLSKQLRTTAVTKNIGVLRKDNPVFNYQTYLKELPEIVVKMTDQALDMMFGNTSKSSHPEVWEILFTEIELRKTQKEQNDKLNRKATRSNTNGNKNAHTTNRNL